MRKFIILLMLVARGFAATYYVDGNLATGSNNGTSWANAWKTLGAMSGLAAGDTVYISGGATGGTCTYSFSDVFPATMGTTGNPITYKIGQDSSHNGTATFNQTSVGFSNGCFFYGGHDVVFSGDAGDGNMHYRLSGTFGSLIVMQGTDSGVRVSYFDLQTLPLIGSINPGNHVEIDHINIVVGNYPAADHALYANFNGATWDDNSIHDCTISLPYNPTNSNFGPDGIQGAGIGYSIYNNTITSYIDNTLTSTQHMDGMQVLGGSYIKAYNNKIVNMTNYGMYWEAAVAVFSNLRVYDNVIICASSVFGTNSSGGIVIEKKVNGDMDNIQLLNNTIVDFPGAGARALTTLNHTGTYTGTFTNSNNYNNLLVNCTTPEYDAGTPTPVTPVNVSAANAATYFSSYSTYAGSANNLHLLAAASSVIHTGTNAQSIFTFTDKDGIAWANPPSVGAYEYFSGSSSTPIYKRLGRYLKLSGIAASILLCFCP